MTTIKPVNIHSYREEMTKEALALLTKFIEKEKDTLSTEDIELFQQVKNRIESFGDFYRLEDMLENGLFDVPQSTTNYGYMIVNPNLNYHHNLDYSKVFPYKTREHTYESEKKLEDAMLWIHGVSDNLDRIDEYVKTKIDEYGNYYQSDLEEIEYVVKVTPILKSHEPKEYGWRWEKWGEYIGTRESKAEYLYDEPEIETIFVFSVIVLERLNNAN